MELQPPHKIRNILKTAMLRILTQDQHILIMCGMSAVFAALFGTPLTATFFAMEVISIGVIYYAGLVPCIISSLTAYGVSVFFGAEPVRFSLTHVPSPTIGSIFQVIGLSALCALLSSKYPADDKSKTSSVTKYGTLSFFMLIIDLEQRQMEI